MTPLTNERPYAVELDVEGQGVVVDAGGVVEVPDDLAGRVPTDDDPGVGLLAQPANWSKASKAKAKAAANEGLVVPSEEQG